MKREKQKLVCWRMKSPSGSISHTWGAQTRSECIAQFMDGEFKTWEEYRKIGWRCVKVILWENK